MQKIIAIALLGTLIGAVPMTAPAFAQDATISERCGPDGDEAYKRPGGYCEQVGATKSLASESKDYPWWWDLPL